MQKSIKKIKVKYFKQININNHAKYIKNAQLLLITLIIVLIFFKTIVCKYYTKPYV